MGPLTGVKMVEFGGIGPPPMCAMLLADMGRISCVSTVPSRPASGFRCPLGFLLWIGAADRWRLI